MTITLAAPAGSIRVVTLGDTGQLLRGSTAEFRHRGISFHPRTDPIGALGELVNGPDLVPLVSTALTGVGLIDFIEVARGLGHPHVLVGRAEGCPDQLLADAICSGAVVVSLPVTPERLLQVIQETIAASAPVVDPSPIEIGDLLVDPVRHAVTWCGRRIDAPAKEFELLWMLMTAAPDAVTMAALLARFVPGAPSEPEARIRVLVARLRARFLQAVPDRCAPIETVHKLGYRIAVTGSPADASPRAGA